MLNISEELLDMASSTEIIAAIGVSDNDNFEFLLWIRLPIQRMTVRKVI
jgi:hypothetical protein